MGACNSTNGEPCCGHEFLLSQVLRKEWGFEGHVVSDCGALDDLYQAPKTVKTKAEAAALALARGVDLNCGDTHTQLPEAVRQGLLKESQVDSALAVLLRALQAGLSRPAKRYPLRPPRAGSGEQRRAPRPGQRSGAQGDAPAQE